MEEDNKFAERVATVFAVILFSLGAVLAIAVVAALVVGVIALAGLVVL